MGLGRGGGEGVRTRDHLANVRTYLAWARCGIAMITAGYAIDKSALLVRVVRRTASPTPARDAVPIAWLVAALGVAITCGALGGFLRARHRIESPAFEPRPGADALLLGLAAAGGLLSFAYLAMLASR